jgi:hypothetical protein
VAYFKVLYQHFPEDISENYEDFSITADLQNSSLQCLQRQEPALKFQFFLSIGVLWLDSRRGLEIFLLTTASRTALGPTQPPIQ